MLVGITVAIGRNLSTGPMDDWSWATFRHDVESVITRRCGGSVQCRIDGIANSAGWGEEETFLAIGDVPEERLFSLREALAMLTEFWAQDAIALTVGVAQFISGDPVKIAERRETLESFRNDLWRKDS